MGYIYGHPIANITGAEIITEDSREVYIIENIRSITPEPVVSEGKEEELRSKNRILAQNILEDILKGYDIKIKDAVFSPEVMAVIQGGSDDGDGSYTAPEADAEQVRPRFILRVYSEEKQSDGTTKSCYSFTFRGCFGTAARFELVDGEFLVPEYTVKSLSHNGKSYMYISRLSAKPVYISSAQDFPVNPEQNRRYIALAPMTVQGQELEPGDAIWYEGGGVYSRDGLLD